MTQFIFTNNAKSTLAAAVGATDTTCTLASGTGAEFPSPGSGEAFALTFLDVATASTYEIAYCTARSGDVLTIARGQEGTTANAYVTGDYAGHFITAGQARSFNQIAGATTANRPASPKLYQVFFDTTLQQPIWCSAITPSIVWVNAAGVAV